MDNLKLHIFGGNLEKHDKVFCGHHVWVLRAFIILILRTTLIRQVVVLSSSFYNCVKETQPGKRGQKASLTQSMSPAAISDLCTPTPEGLSPMGVNSQCVQADSLEVIPLR